MESFKEQKYSLIRDQSNDNARAELDDTPVQKPWQASRSLSLRLVLAIFLVLSVGMNVVTAVRHFTTKSYPVWDTPSLYSEYSWLSFQHVYYAN